MDARRAGQTYRRCRAGQCFFFLVACVLGPGVAAVCWYLCWAAECGLLMGVTAKEEWGMGMAEIGGLEGGGRAHASVSHSGSGGGGGVGGGNRTEGGNGWGI